MCGENKNKTISVWREKDYVHIQEIIAGLNYLFCQLIGALGTKEDHS